jgi:hypothetical protein
MTVVNLAERLGSRYRITYDPRYYSRSGLPWSSPP